jgi:hypothetical protein
MMEAILFPTRRFLQEPHGLTFQATAFFEMRNTLQTGRGGVAKRVTPRYVTYMRKVVHWKPCLRLKGGGAIQYSMRAVDVERYRSSGSETWDQEHV